VICGAFNRSTSVAVMDSEIESAGGRENTIDRALGFCAQLSSQGIRYNMDLVRNDALMIAVAVPSQRWEIEFMSDGSVELERFESLGVKSVVDPFALLAAAMSD
jgi:hypothetical protein